MELFFYLNQSIHMVLLSPPVELVSGIAGPEETKNPSWEKVLRLIRT